MKHFDYTRRPTMAELAEWLAVHGPIGGGAYTYGPAGQIMSAGEAQGKNTNAVMADWVDRGPWQYWDTITFLGGAAVAQTYSPFSIPIGAADPITNTIKTRLQTNMQRGNQFPPPKCLLLMAIGFYFDPTWTKADIAKILNACYMQFKIDDKVFHEGFLWDFPPGGGLTGFTQNSGDAAFILGLPAPQYQRRYGEWSKYIAPIQQFEMLLSFGGGGIAIPTVGTEDVNNYLIVQLDGLTDRSVQ